MGSNQGIARQPAETDAENPPHVSAHDEVGHGRLRSSLDHAGRHDLAVNLDQLLANASWPPGLVVYYDVKAEP
jgi:hypothetical protein